MLNPQTKHYEFCGVPGAILIIFLLPSAIFFIHMTSTKSYKLNVWNLDELPGIITQGFSKVIGLEYFDMEVVTYTIGWFFGSVLLERLLFADIISGTKLRNGQTLQYRINGHLQFWVVIFFLNFGKLKFDSRGHIIEFGAFDLAWIYDKYFEFAFSAIFLATVLSILVFLNSFFGGEKLLALGGNTGNLLYDFFIGRELNPRIGSFDLKEFCELRPGLVGWMVVNLGCAMKQKQLLGYVSYEMILINLFQGLYVWDAQYSEKSILTTMDITSDGFGFMLCFGDLAWVPFSYTLQARYLVENSPGLSPFALIAITTTNLIGFSIFRGANGEKDAFRRDPDAQEVAHLKFIKTASGSKLIVSGWWGLARKINYTGDWLMGLSWSLLTGFGTPVTYFYPIYFCVLLVHRASRDNHMCEVKYGQDWPKYKQMVPYVFIPGVF